MVASRRSAASGGTRPGSRPSGGTPSAAVQIVRDRAAGPAETADRATRPRHEGDDGAAGETVGGEREGGDERQDPEDSWDQGGQAEGEAAEQHEEIHGGTEDRAADPEPGEGEAEGDPREATGGAAEGHERGKATDSR